MKKKVVYLGSRDISYVCLKHLHQMRDVLNYSIEAVVTDELGLKIIHFCQQQGIKRLGGMDDLLGLPDFDVLVSVQYHEILKQEHLNKAGEIAVNLHMAPLPEYRGCNQFSMAIVEGKKEFGTTLHRMTTKIDAGEIIAERRFAIPKGVFVDELYRLTSEHSVALFKEELKKIMEARYTLTSQDSLMASRGGRYIRREEIAQLKKIDLSWPLEKVVRHVRATDMPGFEPPHAMVDGEKVYLTRFRQ